MATISTANALDVLEGRGFVQDVTDRAGLRRLFATERVTFYVGFDPSAASLHVGHLLGIMAMAWLQRLGHRAIAVVGGATGRIGDPSGKATERELLDEQRIAANLAGIRTQLGQFLDLSDADRGLLVDNYDWLGSYRYLAFLRDVGKYFSVNQMITRESVRRRLESREQGISYTEFSYQLLQAYDFAHLYAAEGCRLQGGGSDQWGNITAGIDLTRRLHGGEVYGVTWPLLTTAEGEKFGKTAGNAVWLDAALTSPYAYYQFWINRGDAEVASLLKLFTFLELTEIEELVRTHRADPADRLAQRRLAEEATRTAHGKPGLAEAEGATRVLFGVERFQGLDDRVLAETFDAAPAVELPRERLDCGLPLVELLTEAGAAASSSEARRLVRQGGVYVNNVRVTDERATVGPRDLASATTLVLRVGKKRHHLIRFR